MTAPLAPRPASPIDHDTCTRGLLGVLASRLALHRCDDDLAGVDAHARTMSGLARASRTDERSST